MRGLEVYLYGMDKSELIEAFKKAIDNGLCGDVTKANIGLKAISTWRHEFTNYDKLSEKLATRVERDKLRFRINKMLGKRFDDLIEELRKEL